MPASFCSDYFREKAVIFRGGPRSRQRLCVCSGDEDAYGTQQKYKARRFVISDGKILGDFDKDGNREVV
jgi:hypothetical protein